MSRIKTENEKYLVVVSGPSGCGKDTVVDKLIESNPKCSLSVSFTSRPMRSYEIDGEHYHFVTREDFLKRADEGEMLEYAEYSGHLYGTPFSEIENKLRRGETVILVIDVNGARQIKKTLQNALSVFITPPSLDELERRLKQRHTESDSERKKRLQIAEKEIQSASEYDCVVENDVVTNCAEKLKGIIDSWQASH